MPRIIVCKPGQEPEIVKTDLDLKTMQEIVAGMIQCVPMGAGVDLFMNEEGRMRHLPFNRNVPDRMGQEWDILGNLFLASCDANGNTIGLTDEQIEEWLPKVALRVVEVRDVPEGEIDVYHANHANYFPAETGIPQPPWPHDFRKVGVVETDDINLAYQQTNHITRSWQENEEIVESVESARSSSCGDVFVLPGGTAMRVAGKGFVEVGQEAALAAATKAEEEKRDADAEAMRVENLAKAKVAKGERAEAEKMEGLSGFGDVDWGDLMGDDADAV